MTNNSALPTPSQVHNPHHDSRNAAQTPTPRTVTCPSHQGLARPDLEDWQSWIALGNTPPPASLEETQRAFELVGGRITTPQLWPDDYEPRIYVVYGDHDVVYVGQTSQPLAVRIRRHVGNQTTPSQQRKAGSWRWVVTAAFPDCGPGALDRLERSAANWLLPLRRRDGQRHPRPRPPQV